MTSFLDVLLETLIVHVYRSHRLLLCSLRHALEPAHERLIVKLEFGLDLLLLDCQLIGAEARQMPAIDLDGIEA